MARSIHLADLQYRIMRVLWEEAEATVARVHERLQPEGERALTTIATMLTKMERKGVVDHRSEGRVFVYRPTVSERDVHRSMVSDLTERLFGGDVGLLVNHLLEEQDIDAGELERLRERIAAREREAGEPGDGEAGRDERPSGEA